MGHLDDRPLGIAVEKNIGLGIDQQRMANLVLPVVIVSNAAQRCLNPAEHNRHVLESLTATLAVDQAGTIRALAATATGRIGVIGAHLAVSRVAVDHRVHIAGSHTEKQVWLAQLHEVIFAVPVRLADDTNAVTLRLEQPPDNGHAERRMVDIGVAGNNDHVAAVPAEQVHLLPTHRQERRRTEALGPVTRVVEQLVLRDRNADRHAYSSP